MPSTKRSGDALDDVEDQLRLREVKIVRVGGKFRLKRRIGSGSFGSQSSIVLVVELLKSVLGTVHLGINIVSKEEVAIKLEPADAELPQLQHESEVYKGLNGIGIPSVQWFGTECNYNALVLNRLGPSLEDLFNRCNRKLSLKTVLLLADQMVCKLIELCIWLQLNPRLHRFHA